jgi:hypothetical protein
MQEVTRARQKSLSVRTHYNNLVAQNYTEEPVDIWKFLSDPDYLGNATSNGTVIFPIWKDALIKMFDDNTKLVVVLTGSIGTGKSTIALYALCYIQYRLMILREPWKFFGLGDSGKMTISFFNLNRTLGDSRGYSKMMDFMSKSPWFRKNALHITPTKRGEILEFKLIKYVLASPACLSGDTKIPLLDGRTLTMLEMVSEIQAGKELWTYSYDVERMELVPGRVLSAFQSYENARVIAVTLDNGEVIKCTPNHRFLLRDGTYKKAEDLVEGESIMPLYRKLDELGYEQYLHVVLNTWYCTHRCAAGRMPGELSDKKGKYVKGIVVHHRDCNKRNNNPTNLQWMTWEDHQKWHRDHARLTLGKPGVRAKAEITLAKIRQTPEYKAKIKASLAIVHAEPEYHKKLSDAVNNSDRWTEEKRAVHAEQVGQRMRDGQASAMQKKAVTPEALAKKSVSHAVYWASEKGQQDKKIRSERMRREMLAGRAKEMNNLRNDKETNPTNHKIVSVIPVDNSDVYDLTIDKYSNFALDSGVFVHNSAGFGVVGEDVVAGIMDEVDSPMDPDGQKKRVGETYNATIKRFKSRFALTGYSLGKLFVVCSKQDEASFIDIFIAERSKDPEILIFDIPLWDAKPKHLFSGVTFPIAVGDAYNPSRIIEEKDIAQYVQSGFRIVRPPIEFKRDFILDLVGSLRDVAGVTTAGTRKMKLFPSESFIIDCFDKTKEDPVKKETVETGLNDEVPLIKYIDITKFRLPPSTPRFIHYDISFTTDASGVSMCGVKDWRYVEVQNQDGSYRRELVPIIETDFVLRLKAFDGDRLPPHKVRKLVLDLRQMGINIRKFTADLQMAAEETLQLLKSVGIDTELISLDKTNKIYYDFRNLVFEKRWICHRHNLLLTELSNLQQGPDGKVDHPDKFLETKVLEDGSITEDNRIGSKDISDSVAGSTAMCLYNNERPMDTQLMSALLKKGSLAPNPQNSTLAKEDINKILPLKDSDGSIIIGTADRDGQVESINSIFKRLLNR